jgi:hypothetical protein
MAGYSTGVHDSDCLFSEFCGVPVVEVVI